MRVTLVVFIRNRYEELASGGVWINRDVVGPEEKEKMVLIKLSTSDGRHDDHDKTFEKREDLKNYLQNLSTYGRFLRFALDFRRKEGYKVIYRILTINGEEYIEIKLKDACEFMSRKDYIGNWQSEMHETFCFWDLNEWKQNLELVGFTVTAESKAYTNEWIVENRLKGKVGLVTREMTVNQSFHH